MDKTKEAKTRIISDYWIENIIIECSESEASLFRMFAKRLCEKTAVRDWVRFANRFGLTPSNRQ